MSQKLTGVRKPPSTRQERLDRVHKVLDEITSPQDLSDFVDLINTRRTEIYAMQEGQIKTLYKIGTFIHMTDKYARNGIVGRVVKINRKSVGVTDCVPVMHSNKDSCVRIHRNCTVHPSFIKGIITQDKYNEYVHNCNAYFPSFLVSDDEWEDRCACRGKYEGFPPVQLQPILNGTR